MFLGQGYHEWIIRFVVGRNTTVESEILHNIAEWFSREISDFFLCGSVERENLVGAGLVKLGIGAYHMTGWTEIEKMVGIMNVAYDTSAVVLYLNSPQWTVVVHRFCQVNISTCIIFVDVLSVPCNIQSVFSIAEWILFLAFFAHNPVAGLAFGEFVGMEYRSIFVDQCAWCPCTVFKGGWGYTEHADVAASCVFSKVFEGEVFETGPVRITTVGIL